MTKWNAGVITANSIDVPVWVDDYNGHWTAVYAGKNLSYDTRDKLTGALARLTKKTKIEVEVPVIRIKEYRGYGDGNITVARGTLTGIHSGNGNVLATWIVRGTEVKEQITHESGTSYVGADTTDEQLAEYNRLLRLAKKTQLEITDWERSHEIRPKGAVETVLDAKAGSGEDDDA
jgi:hypothetical protein